MSDRLIELERRDAALKALADACRELENYSTNEQYRKAFDKAIRIIQQLAETFVSEVYTDKSPEQRNTS